MFVRYYLLILVCLIPIRSEAAVIINEVAWPHTYFVIVLTISFVVFVIALSRTTVCQSKCLGKIGILICIVSLPCVSQAAVIINEVAWMGTEVSANDEWIELHNNGDSEVPLDGWILSDSNGLEVELAGTIGAGQYAVLERTDDDSASGSAFLIYTGALSNAGVTLTLKRDGGGIEDQVAGGEDWNNIGGDNVTKETAQYTSSGWITAGATPGKKNNAYDTSDNTNEESDETDKETESKKKSINNTAVVLELPDVELSLSLDVPEMIYVNQPVNFEVEPSGLGDVIMDSLQYNWNFGDLNTGVGNKAVHSYEYPGEYVLTVQGKYTRYEQVARKVVKVLPVTFTLTRNSAGDIMLHNNAHYEVDISGYKLFASGPFRFPAYTILLPQATITIPKEKVGAHLASTVILKDMENNIVASVSPALSAKVENVVTLGESTQQAPLAPAVSTVTNFNFQSTKSEPTLEKEIKPIETPINDSVKDPTSVQSATVAHSNKTIPREVWPYLGLIVLLAVGIFAVYFSSQKDY